MRAPFCNDSSDICLEDKVIIVSENETDNEIHGIERSLARRDSNKAAVFGICLDDLMGITPQVVPQIPFILSRLCRYIETHGLHRKCLFLEGEEKNMVESLKVEFIECGDAPLEIADNVISVSKLLIVFFEELPESLIPVSVQHDFIQDFEKLSLKSMGCIGHFKQNVCKLPDSAYEVLKYLSRFLLRVACHQEYNGMSSDSLAVIFAPLIFRTTSTDPVLLLKFKNITNCFVQDYHSIFEDTKSRLPEDHKTSSMKTCMKVGRQILCSSIRPVMSLSPLTVLIPPIDTSSDNVAQESVPILLIERSTNGNFEAKVCSTGSSPNKTNTGSCVCAGVLVTRKRKERRPSGEESQPRSSSEERPNTLLSMEKMDLIRRCNSHEEVVEGKKMNAEAVVFPKDDLSKETSAHHVDSYLSNTVELVLSEKNQSPHPPNAKRREVDTAESDIKSADHWKYHNMSKFSEYENPVSRPDMSCLSDSKQNLIAELTEKCNMDCDSLNEDSAVVDDEGEFLESKNAGIPRSASCPVPKSDDDGSSESENSSLSLSWSMLFEDSEPVRAEHPVNWSSCEIQSDAVLSPSVQQLRNSNYYDAPLSPSAFKSYLSHRSSHLDSSIPPSPPFEQEDFAKKYVESSVVSDSIRQLTKKIHGIKRRIKKFDEKFEADYGYKPSHAEKSNNVDAKKLLTDLYKARKELKALKEESHLEHVSPVSSTWHASQCGNILGDTTNQPLQECTKDKSKPSVEDSIEMTWKSLSNERRLVNRPELFEAMTTEQVGDEKVAIQKALLHFESLHEKPLTKEERKSIKPLYERYRNVKKFLVRSGAFVGPVLKSKEVCSELQPILEHETMDFPSREQRTTEEAEVSVKDGEKAESAVIKKEETETATNAVPQTSDSKVTSNSSFLTMKYDNSNFHELPLSEMIFQMQKVKSEKRHLRKILKEFETEFLKLNGRKVQQEDKAPVETIYSEYKHVKARLKLLEALISKHDQHQL